MKRRCEVKIFKKCKHLMITSVVLLNTLAVTAQDGNAGINEANTQLRSYFDSGTNLMYA